MGAYFRKSIKIAPGVHLNLSKRGTGVSFGVKGAHISYSPTGRVTKTVGIPGTGIYFRDVESPHSKSASNASSPSTPPSDYKDSTSFSPPTPNALHVEAVEHHGFYISHGFAAFTLLLAGVLVDNGSHTQSRNIWALVLLIAGFTSLGLWLRDLMHTNKESRNHNE